MHAGSTALTAGPALLVPPPAAGELASGEFVPDAGDLLARDIYLCRHAPHRLPGRLRGLRCLILIECYVWFPALLAAAVAGVGFVFSAVNTRPVVAAVVYGVVVLYAAVQGLRRGGFLRRFFGGLADRMFRYFLRLRATKLASDGTFPAGHRCRVVLAEQQFALEGSNAGAHDAPAPGRRIRVAAPWGALHQIVEAEGHLLFLIRQGETILVPRRAFPDEETFARFLAVARRRQADSGIAGTVPGERVRADAIRKPEDRTIGGPLPERPPDDGRDVSTQRFNGVDVRTPAGGFEMFYKLDFEDHVALHMWRYDQEGTVKGEPKEGAALPRWLWGALAVGHGLLFSLALMTIIADLTNSGQVTATTGIGLLAAYGVAGLIGLSFRLLPRRLRRDLLRRGAKADIRKGLQEAQSNGTFRPNLEVIAQFDDAGFHVVQEWESRGTEFRKHERKQVSGAWWRVDAVAEYADRVFFQVGSEYLIVPCEVFPDEATFDEFLAAVERWRLASWPPNLRPRGGRANP
jgi:hypothetical protein